jgi:hypothetical protein
LGSTLGHLGQIWRERCISCTNQNQTQQHTTNHCISISVCQRITEDIRCLTRRNAKTQPVAVFQRKDRTSAVPTAKGQRGPLRLSASVDTPHSKATQPGFSQGINFKVDASRPRSTNILPRPRPPWGSWANRFGQVTLALLIPRESMHGATLRLTCRLHESNLESSSD